MTSGIIYEGRSAEIDEEARRRFEASFYIPGDKVRPLESKQIGPTLSDAHQKLLAAMSERKAETLTVKSLIATDDHLAVQEFVELDGRWNAALIEDARGCEHLYGCVINREDGAWLVPLTQDFDNPKADPAHTPFALAAKMERHAVWQIGEEDSGKLDGAVGEFVVVPVEGGRHAVVALPWTTDASEKESAEAERAVNLFEAAGLTP